jgi:hypothetical protein
MIDEELVTQVIGNDVVAKMHRCHIIYRRGHQMCSSIGSTRRQAERNAAVLGLLWLEEHRDEVMKSLNMRQQATTAQLVAAQPQATASVRMI